MELTLHQLTDKVTNCYQTNAPMLSQYRFHARKHFRGERLDSSFDLSVVICFLLVAVFLSPTSPRTRHTS